MSKTTVCSQALKLMARGRVGEQLSTLTRPYVCTKKIFTGHHRDRPKYYALHINHDAYLLLYSFVNFLFTALPKFLLPSTSEFTSDKSFIPPSSFEFVWQFFWSDPLIHFLTKKTSPCLR